MTKKYKDFIMLIMMLLIILVYSAIKPTMTHVSLIEDAMMVANSPNTITVTAPPEETKPTEPVVQPKKPREVARELDKQREVDTPSRGTKREYSIVVTSSAYTTAPDEGSGTGLAFDGNPATAYHTIAVDPRVIPLGSKVLVPGIGWMIAHDTGSAIKGNRADICVNTKKEAYAWGVREITIKVIAPE